ncbi:hypothetical protein [Serratia marcescens]|uniref:hypothetical protein n=1 Tax=Serratia marcescens TaxID=615 RepID=UPI0007603CA3|nr:hypothetical protein [Serratia marcescens]
MTYTTEQLKARAVQIGLDFFIEERSGSWVKEWVSNGCTQATDEEITMWRLLVDHEYSTDESGGNERISCGDSVETIEKNPKSWIAWRREAERLQTVIDATLGAQPTPDVPREIMNCLAFFASVIKSGEPWTETCQRDYDAAMKAAEPKVLNDSDTGKRFGD